MCECQLIIEVFDTLLINKDCIYIIHYVYIFLISFSCESQLFN